MKKFLSLTVALGILSFFVLTGCQSLGQQIGQKIGEKMIENATGSKVAINNSNGSVNIKTKDGTASMGGGNTRPDSVSADLPSIDGAKDFSWFGSTDGGMFAYNVESADYKAVCTQEMDLLAKAGWKKNDSYSLDVDKMMTRSFEMPGFSLSATCSLDSNEGEAPKVGVVLTKSKK